MWNKKQRLVIQAAFAVALAMFVFEPVGVPVMGTMTSVHYVCLISDKALPPTDWIRLLSQYALLVVFTVGAVKMLATPPTS